MASSYTSTQAQALLTAHALYVLGASTIQTTASGEKTVSSALTAPVSTAISSILKSGSGVTTITDLKTHLVTTMTAHVSYGNATVATNDLNTYTNVLLANAAGFPSTIHGEANAVQASFNALQTKIVTALQVLL